MYEYRVDISGFLSHPGDHTIGKKSIGAPPKKICFHYQKVFFSNIALSTLGLLLQLFFLSKYFIFFHIFFSLLQSIIYDVVALKGDSNYHWVQERATTIDIAKVGRVITLKKKARSKEMITNVAKKIKNNNFTGSMAIEKSLIFLS